MTNLRLDSQALSGCEGRGLQERDSLSGFLMPRGDLLRELFGDEGRRMLGLCLRSHSLIRAQGL